MGRQQWVYRIEPSRFPRDFPERLERFKEASGMSWRELARRLRTDIRLVNRWRKGTRPDSANLIALFNLAAGAGPAAPAAAGGGETGAGQGKGGRRGGGLRADNREGRGPA